MMIRKLSLRSEAGVGALGALITILLAAAALLSILGVAVKNSTEYNRFHAIARDVADDPSSHSDEEILNSGQALYDLMNETTQGGTIVPGTGGALGVKLILQADRALNDVRNQQYIVKISTSPADPGPGQGVTVVVNVLNSLTGTPVQYEVSGSDGYHDTGTANTDSGGSISFFVPGGAEGVTDVVVITVGSVQETYTYVF
jgi:hypothetical protein